VPSGVVEAEVHRHLEGENRLEDAEHRAEVEAETRESLTERILLDTLAEQLAVQVGQEELLEYLVNASAQYGMDPNTFIQTVDKQGQLPSMVAEVGRTKATAVALRQVTVVDGSGAPVDLTPFIGPAEDARPDADDGVVYDDEVTAPADDAPAADVPADEA
jgi:trigger factor